MNGKLRGIRLSLRCYEISYPSGLSPDEEIRSIPEWLNAFFKSVLSSRSNDSLSLRSLRHTHADIGLLARKNCIMHNDALVSVESQTQTHSFHKKPKTFETSTTKESVMNELRLILGEITTRRFHNISSPCESKSVQKQLTVNKLLRYLTKESHLRT